MFVFELAAMIKIFSIFFFVRPTVFLSILLVIVIFILVHQTVIYIATAIGSAAAKEDEKEDMWVPSTF